LLGGYKLNKYVIAIPNTKEQTRIIEKVEQLTSICEQLKVGIQQAQQAQLHLADAVVENSLN
jgi:type I restriction enzyme S subunit